MRVLGIDPGLRCTGFGLIDVHDGKLHYLASGTISTAKAPSTDLPTRIGILFGSLCQVLERYQPQVAAIEIVFVNVNPQATLKLGQARGACLCALAQAGIATREYTALQMKKAVAGHGRAAKPQVQEMVRRLLALPALPGPDAADALGMAITHAQVQRPLALMHQSAQMPTGAGGYRRGRVA